jgi:acyl carrier protein
MTETERLIQGMFAEAVPELEFDPVTDAEKTFAELGLDSLDKMSVLLAVQEHWGVEFSAAEIGELTSFAAICRKVGA